MSDTDLDAAFAAFELPATTAAKLAPLMTAKLLTYHEFRRAHPAVRCFFKFSPGQRANLRSSHRLTNGQREALGEKYYTHPMVPDVAFSTAKAATVRAYALYLGPEPC